MSTILNERKNLVMATCIVALSSFGALSAASFSGSAGRSDQNMNYNDSYDLDRQNYDRRATAYNDKRDADDDSDSDDEDDDDDDDLALYDNDYDERNFYDNQRDFDRQVAVVYITPYVDDGFYYSARPRYYSRYYGSYPNYYGAYPNYYGAYPYYSSNLYSPYIGIGLGGVGWGGYRGGWGGYRGGWGGHHHHGHYHHHHRGHRHH